jgi:poly-gamma-glutamate synthesis protein (capsule biosynthesis protein)
MWGRTVETRARASEFGYSYPTHGLAKTERDKYDAWIANFECPITKNTESVSVQISALKFNCRPEFLPNFAKWFTAVSLANNHTMNQGGQAGLIESRQHLEKAGIQYFGNYDTAKLNDICEIVSLPARTATTHKQVSIPVALCGYMQVVNVAPTDEQLAVMEKYAKVMPVIAMPHMGVEYRATAEPEKVSAYHRMIDHGADAVIAAHPHVIQNSESYKGRLIAYSLGNFLFDQQSLGDNTTLGLGVGVTLSVEDAKAAEIYANVASRCKAFHDSCLAQLAAKLQSRPAIKVVYSFICLDESRAVGSVPHLGSNVRCDQAKRQATVNKLTDLGKQW